MDIDQFRWILAGLGVVLVAGIYIRETLRRRTRVDDDPQDPVAQPSESEFSLRADQNQYEESLELPSIRTDAYDSVVLEADGSESAVELDEAELPQHPRPASSDPIKVVQMKVVAPRDALFKGPILMDGLVAAGLEYGAMDIYHKATANGNDPLFSVGNMVEPGTFPQESVEDFESPGVVFFFQVAEAGRMLNTFDEMVRTVHILAARIGGEIRDEENRPLTVEKTESIRKSLANLG